MTLQEFFTESPKAALGFSGGVDSSYLLWAAVNAGADIAPYYIQTAFQPAFELEDAQRLCEQIGVKLNVIQLDALADPRVAANPANRCYYCKVGLFGALRARAKADGYDLVPTGRTITPELLRRVEGAETALFALGFTDFRVRLYDDAARLQLPEGQLAKAVEQRQAIRQALAPWFDIVLLDTQTR